jgi:hypothetical protein
MGSPVRVRAIRLSRPLAERLEWAAQEAGGRRRAIERMLGQTLPAREWFHARRMRPPHPIRVSFRLSRETVRRLRAVTGIRSLSDAVRLVIYYTVTEGIGASATRPAPPAPAVPSFGASLPVSRPAAPSEPSSPPPGRSPIGAAPHPFHRSLQMGFEHRPVLPAGQHYACEVRECVNWLPDGVVARCSSHEKARSLR